MADKSDWEYTVSSLGITKTTIQEAFFIKDWDGIWKGIDKHFYNIGTYLAPTDKMTVASVALQAIDSAVSEEDVETYGALVLQYFVELISKYPDKYLDCRPQDIEVSN